MFIEFIDQFRCPNPHEESWLVATFFEREDRFLVRGLLGCHLCMQQYPVEHGIVYFRDTTTISPRLSTPDTPSNLAHETLEGDPEMAMRAAAFLHATEHATVVVAGSWARHAHEMTQILPIRVFAMNPGGILQESESVGIFESSRGVPFSVNSVHGIAFDRDTATPLSMESAIKVLRPGGRLVAPVSMEVPPQITVLASDDAFWVGEKAVEMVSLRKA